MFRIRCPDCCPLSNLNKKPTGNPVNLPPQAKMALHPNEHATTLFLKSWRSTTGIADQIRSAKQQLYVNLRELSRKKESGSAVNQNREKGAKKEIKQVKKTKIFSCKI